MFNLVLPKGKSQGKVNQTLMQLPFSTSSIPRQLYPPLPAQFRVALSSVYSREILVVNPAFPNQAFYGGVNDYLHSPFVGNGCAEGLFSLLSLYGKASVDRVEFHIRFTNTCERPINWASTVIPQGSLYQPDSIDFFERVASHPSAVIGTISSRGSDSASFRRTYDVTALMAEASLEGQFCTTSSLGPAGTVNITRPNILSSAVPLLTMFFQNEDPLTDADKIVLLYQVTYHMTFTNRHATSVRQNGT